MRLVTRSLLEVAAVHGLLAWLYVAACAATRPDSMSRAITTVVPMRRDTFGVWSFAVSSLAAFALQVRGEIPILMSPRQRRIPRTGPVDSALRTLVVYALLVWAYLCVNSLTHPQTIARQLTHFAAVPSEGTTAVVCFAASAAALLALRVRGVSAREPVTGG
jgi:hypothetical protein